VCGQRVCAGEKGGEKAGPNPTDRGRPGSKRHVITDANGIPLAVQLTDANVHDSRVFEDLIDAVSPIQQRRGRPRMPPAKLHADKAYDVPRCREALRRRRIKARIARRRVDSSERLGRHRWVVERTLAWFSRFRRLTVRYDRRADIHQAFLSLAASLICWSYVQRWMCGDDSAPLQ
jgi:transposase